jgi:CRP-like cAMP-binding protein
MAIITLPPKSDPLQSIQPGQKIFNQGQSGDWMYVVVEGEVDLLINDVLVERVGPGGVLGEMALLDAAPRSATAIAHTACRLWPINRRRFSLIIQETPEFALQVMRAMAGRLRRMDRRLHA